MKTGAQLTVDILGRITEKKPKFEMSKPLL